MNTLALMRTFLAILDQGSLAAASRALGRSPAAVTRDLALLEAHLGASLITRTSRRLHPTHEGRRFAEDARRILADLADAEARAAGQGGRIAGPVAVTAPATFGRLHVGPALLDLAARHPLLALRGQFTDRVLDLVAHGIDIAIRIGPLAESDLRAVRLGSVRVLRVAAPGTGPGPEGFAPVGRGDGSPLWPGEARLAFDSIDLVRLAVERGLGEADLLSYQAIDGLEAGRLRVLDRGGGDLPVHAVHPGGARLSPRCRLVFDHLVAALRQELADQERRLDALGGPIRPAAS